MSFLGSITRFFGFTKQAPPPAPEKSLADLFTDRLKAVSPEEKVQFLANEQKRADEESMSLISRARGQSGDADHFFATARAHFAFEVFLTKQAIAGALSSDGVNLTLEQVLGRLVAYAEVFAKPAPELISFLEQYIQTFEEHILLAEARGQYSIKVSEQGKWFKMPFLQKDSHLLRRQDASTKLATQFKDCAELSLLELDTHVPWQPISFLEFSQKAKSGRMVLLREPKTEQYFAYLYI